MRVCVYVCVSACVCASVCPSIAIDLHNLLWSPLASLILSLSLHCHSSPLPLSLLFSRAHKLAEAGKLQEAVALLEHAAGLYSGDVRLHVSMAMMYEVNCIS